MCFRTRAQHHRTPFHFVSSIVLAPTELALVDFDGLVRTVDFLTAAQHIVQHDLSTEFGPNQWWLQNRTDALAG